MAIGLLVLFGCALPKALSLRISFPGDALSIHETSDGITIEYCPDNTCEAFFSPESDARAELLDFVALYLFYVSDYYVLADFRADNVAAVAEMMRAHHERCPDAIQRTRASCIMRSAAQRNAIRVFHVRYDEDQRTEEPVDLDAQLEALAQR